MAYTPRYKFKFSNDLNELIEIYFDAKDGVGSTYTGTSFITIIDDDTMILNSGFEIAAIIIGTYISFGGNNYLITGFSYDTGNYTIEIGAGGLTPVPSGVKTYTIGPIGTVVGMEEFTNIISCQINKSSDSSLITDPIVWSELTFSVHVLIGSTIEFTSFLTSDHDDWQVRMYNDGQAVFHGFLVPDEGSIALQDKPYEVTFKAVDGLKLLSNIALTKQDGTEFNVKHNFLDFVAACLYKTGLNLPIRIYCNIYYTGMVTRADNIMYDTFQQVYLDYRTFMTSATVFMNCYDALVKILKNHFQLRYKLGVWEIYRVTEAQYLPEGNRYYTDYQYTGSIIGGAIDTDDFGKIGKNNITRAIEENQYKSARFAYKSVKHTFKYNIWDEIPRNNKFERAVLDPLAPNTATEKYYTVSNWDYGHQNTPTGLPFPAAVTSAKAWRKSTLNTFGVEIDREIQLQAALVDSSFAKQFRSDPIPVNQNDKIQLSFQIRLTNTVGTPGNYLAARVYIITGGTKYFLDDAPLTGGVGPWVTSYAAISAIYNSGDDSAKYMQVDVSSASIPADGDLYIHFIADSVAGNNVFIKDFNLTYTPYVAGGYLPVKGDYWTRKQNKNFADTFSDEIEISDSPIGAGKGTLFFFTGLYPKTTPNWHRYGLSETRHFKELVNMAMYNLTYRRFLKIEGDFDGTKYSNNIDLAQYPVSFTPRYKFEDVSANSLFLLCCPVKIDYIKGRFSATFQEVWASAADGTQVGDSSEFKYLFE